MMMTHALGKTGLQVTPLGLGLAALGRPGYINLHHAEDLGGDYSVADMQRHAHAVLDAAWGAGIRYFDAARSYGRAEEFLGAWLTARGISPKEVTVGSKWGYVYTAGWQVQAAVHEVKQHTVEVLRRQREETREFLGEYLDLYQIHSATLESGVLENREVLAELARYRADGLVIGLTLSGPRQAETLRRALEVRVDGRALFGAVQATWNLLEPSAGAALQEASAAGVGVIVKEALANGRLTARNDEPDFAAGRALLAQAAVERSATIDALALAAVLAQPWAGVVLSGAAAPDQVVSNAAALQVNWDAGLNERLASLAEPPEEYWSRRSALAWG
ncbi:MAG TPA: aldo/keto reductase [Anaerolineaceae bacterium]|jgi:aryl-alcohol dehydrogenase-like predicted oxidoreductase